MKFKCFIFFMFMMLVTVGLRAEIVGDFNGDSKTTLKDVVIATSWLMVSKSADTNLVLTRAREILSSVSSIARLPSDTIDDLNADGRVSLADVILMLAWYQVSDRNNLDKVKLRASSLGPAMAAEYASLQRLPETDSATNTIAVTSVTLNKNIASLFAGSNDTLVATVAPADATNKSVWFSSSNPSVAMVASMSGHVSAVAVGTATITVTTADGGKTATCIVSVIASSGATEPAAEDKAAIQGIIDARLGLDLKKYSGQPIVTAEVDAVYATLSPMYLESGMNAAEWRIEALSPVATDEADVANFSGTGWEFQQISPDTWLVARLGNVNLKDGSSVPMAGLSSFWQYSADLRALTSHTSRKLDPETHAIQLVRKENGVWKILGDQVKIFDGSIQIQFSRYGVDNSVNTGLFTFLTEDPKFPVASVVASGSFINGTVGLAKASGSNQWNNFNVGNACTYTGIAPNNPGAKIGIKVTFVDGSTQTYVFSQPDTTGMDPLSVTISADSKTFEWGSIAPQEKLREFSITFTDQATGQQLALPKFTTSDATVTQHSFSDQDLELLSGKQVWIHIHQFRNDGINRQFFTQKTFP
jgi:hypothetical protein